ncbi:MAG: valine--tRNA ligase, partial [Muribaculaceae bacterium]|nr:valine--tRNA ligase [Muribaculaceae bacterium]
VRGVRASKNIPPKEVLALHAVGASPVDLAPVVVKLANLSEYVCATEKDATAASFMVGTQEYNVPLASTIDVEAEIERLQKDLDYACGFKASVEKKLSNERFVNNAPAAVVETERRKLADAESKIAALTASIAALKNQ